MLGGVSHRVDRPVPAHSPERWRLIVHPPGPAAWNMAMDEAILEAVAAGQAPPTLRLYRWNPPAVSLGYFQDFERSVNEAACRQAGVDVVRRPTGGRAVFHHREVTYSVCLPPGHPIASGGVLASYRRISEALQEGLRLLGVASELAVHARRPAGWAAGACFDTPSRYELEWQGRKLVGSAQLRRASGALLQHGSILLELDAALAGRLLAPGGRGAELLAKVLRARAVSLAEATGRAVGFEEASACVAAGFERRLGVRLHRTGPGAAEEARAAELVALRYGREEWNRRSPAGRGRAGMAV